MARERPGHTFQTTELVGEAYLRLVDQKSVSWKDRAHFLAVAALVMRHVLVDHARRRMYAKRGGANFKVSLSEADSFAVERAADLVALDDALGALAAYDERKSRVVELRFFGGLTVEETAEVLEVSPVTVSRELRAAKAWLLEALSSPTA
jgi:RNA polymerase sigma factor (TIGR02999 family)